MALYPGDTTTQNITYKVNDTLTDPTSVKVTIKDPLNDTLVSLANATKNIVLFSLRFGDVVQLVRILACHARAHGFNPLHPRQINFRITSTLRHWPCLWEYLTE